MTLPSLSGRLLALALATATMASAQTQETLFPGQEGATLRSSLRAAYKPASVLSSGQSKDRMVDTVDRATVGSQDGAVGVYTGWFVPFDGNPSADPNQDVFNGGSGLNQEHVWPRSRGAECGNSGDPPACDGRAETDLHHLYPSRVAVNSDRGSLAFAEITDTQANRWYRNDDAQSSPPPVAERDEWSEIVLSQRFEPREEVKGDVARAMFYFATMYGPTNLNSGDQAWFETQRLTLYQWHVDDPITAADQARSQRVAPFQSNRDNPFVLDSALVRRAWVPEVIVTDEAAPAEPAPALRLAGAHPFRSAGRLALALPAAAPVRAELFDALGRRVAVLHDAAAAAGTLALHVDGTRLAPGVYHARVQVAGQVLAARVVRVR